MSTSSVAWYSRTVSCSEKFSEASVETLTWRSSTCRDASVVFVVYLSSGCEHTTRRCKQDQRTLVALKCLDDLDTGASLCVHVAIVYDCFCSTHTKPIPARSLSCRQSAASTRGWPRAASPACWQCPRGTQRPCRLRPSFSVSPSEIKKTAGRNWTGQFVAQGSDYQGHYCTAAVIRR